MDIKDKRRWKGVRCANEKYIHSYTRGMAPVSQRQMPLYSQVGKGLRGDSATIEMDFDDGFPKLVGKYFNQMTEQEEVLWELPMLDMVPKLHYRVMRCVREHDGKLMWGFYTHYSCSIENENRLYIFWEFDTPITYTDPFYGDQVPDDYIIESDEEN